MASTSREESHPCLRAFIALPQKLGLVPGTSIGCLTTGINYSSNGYSDLWSLWALAHTHTVHISTGTDKYTDK